MTSSDKRLAWGILGTGSIARTFAKGVLESHHGRLVAVGSRSAQSANAFAEQFDIPNRHATYEELLADPEVEAIYLATPHPMHAEWAIKIADAGKHVLCEKPLTVHYPDAQRVALAATRNGVVLMEAFMYRCHPQTARVVELVKSGALGDVLQIEARFCFAAGENPESRLYNLELGGGAILDVGCYTVSYSRLIAGAALGLPFAEPTEVKGLGRFASTGADAQAVAVLRFAGGIIAVCTTAVGMNGGENVRIVGTKGTLVIPSPYFCCATDGAVKVFLETYGAGREEIVIPVDRSLYAYEADLFAEAVTAGQVPVPGQGAADSLSNMRTLDLWRREIGLSYPQETLARQDRPASGKVRVYANPMTYGSLPRVTGPDGTPKRISRLVMGTMIEGAINPVTHAMALFDDFYERGGTCFDSAYVYSGGNGERLLGHWLKTRGVRDEITVIGKGAHTPHCHPEGLNREFAETLERLQLPGVDIYMMHRDNLDIPASVFVDVLNEHVRAGRMKEFGGSNWSIERVQEANDYAQAKGLQPFTVVSNNFSLARLVDPVWAGCVSSSDGSSREWLTEHQIALFSWSSQARGFFARGDRDFNGDAELVRCWYAEDNFERLERAQQLAKERGVSPVAIAAAYVLAQNFPIYALIGPRVLAETGDSMDVFKVQLTPAEVKWLNLED